MCASNQDSVLGDRINSLAVSVDEYDVGKVEGWEVVVMKTWSLAPTRIPRLQFISHCFVFDYVFDAMTNPFLAWEIKGMQGSDTGGYRVHCNHWRAPNKAAD
jgi:hypothetical protein